MKRYLPFLLVVLLGTFPLCAQEGARGLVVVEEQEISDLPSSSGKRYAICIGVNGYEDANIQDLDKASNDAKALGKVLKEYGQFDVFPDKGYAHHEFPDGFSAHWVRVKANKACRATVYFVYR